MHCVSVGLKNINRNQNQSNCLICQPKIKHGVCNIQIFKNKQLRSDLVMEDTRLLPDFYELALLN